MPTAQTKERPLRAMTRARSFGLIDTRMWRAGRFDQIEDPPVPRREDVEMVRRYQGGRGRSGRRRKAGDGAGPRIDGLDLARFFNRDMHDAAGRIEEGGIRRAAKRPLGAELAG